MSNYRRLISYIYAYEGGTKGKNIGFAKIEIRNGQCRIHVNVKKIFLGSSDIGVYLLSPGKEILLGRIFIRNGAGEFRVNVSAGNVEGSGCSMDQCYGLTIHETENTWRTYTTIWEDAVAQAAEVELANVTSEKMRVQALHEPRPFVSEEIQRELEREDARQDGMMTWQEEEKDDDIKEQQKETEGESQREIREESLKDELKEVSEGGTENGATERPVEGADENPEEGIREIQEEQTGGNQEEQTGGNQEEQTEGNQGEQTGGNQGEQAEGNQGEQAGGNQGEQAEGNQGEQAGGNQEEQAGGNQGEQAEGSQGERTGESQEESPKKIQEEKPGSNADAGVDGGQEQASGQNEKMPEEEQEDKGKKQEKNKGGPQAEKRSPGERLLEQLMTERPVSGDNAEENTSQNRVQEKVMKFARAFMQGKSPGTDAMARQKTVSPAAEGTPRQASVVETTPVSLPEPGDPARLKELDRQDREEAIRGTIWSRLQNQYPKVLAFDYIHDCEILTIKPQDIGILPRENWVYGNNSFLLHGYYNYRHLILARLENPGGEPRYLLGVPGHYFSNEKNLASMFGFPHFVLAKKQPEEDGRFGYWYTDLRL